MNSHDPHQSNEWDVNPHSQWQDELPTDPHELPLESIGLVLEYYVAGQLSEAQKQQVSDWLAQYPDVTARYHRHVALAEGLGHLKEVLGASTAIDAIPDDPSFDAMADKAWASISQSLERDKELGRRMTPEQVDVYDWPYISAYWDNEITEEDGDKTVFEQLLATHLDLSHQLATMSSVSTAYRDFIHRLESRCTFDVTAPVMAQVMDALAEDAPPMPMDSHGDAHGASVEGELELPVVVPPGLTEHQVEQLSAFLDGELNQKDELSLSKLMESHQPSQQWVQSVHRVRDDIQAVSLRLGELCPDLTLAVMEAFQADPEGALPSPFLSGAGAEDTSLPNNVVAFPQGAPEPRKTRPTSSGGKKGFLPSAPWHWISTATAAAAAVFLIWVSPVQDMVNSNRLEGEMAAVPEEALAESAEADAVDASGADDSRDYVAMVPDAESSASFYDAVAEGDFAQAKAIVQEEEQQPRTAPQPTVVPTVSNALVAEPSTSSTAKAEDTDTNRENNTRPAAKPGPSWLAAVPASMDERRLGAGVASSSGTAIPRRQRMAPRMTVVRSDSVASRNMAAADSVISVQPVSTRGGGMVNSFAPMGRAAKSVQPPAAESVAMAPAAPAGSGSAATGAGKRGNDGIPSSEEYLMETVWQDSDADSPLEVLMDSSAPPPF